MKNKSRHRKLKITFDKNVYQPEPSVTKNLDYMSNKTPSPQFTNKWSVLMRR